MADCTNCPDSNKQQSFFSYPMVQSVPCSSDCDTTMDTTCVIYTGAALTCSDVATNTNLQTILQAMDTAICAAGEAGYNPDWDTTCLGPYTTMEQFVEGICSFVCDVRQDVGEVTNNFDAYVESNDAVILTIENPNTTASAYANISSVDTLFSVLNKLSVAVQSLADSSAVSGADWNQCFVVSPLPTTIEEAFDTVIDMICTVKAAIPENLTLPTFDNTTSCLSSPTATDSLVTTVTKIRDLLCTKPDFDGNSLSTGCLDIDTTDLQSTTQEIITALIDVSQDSIRAVNGSQFTTAYIDAENPCLGLTLSLADDLGVSDRLVALNSEDEDPGTLEDKVVEGDNITLDFGLANAGQLTISATDNKVGASSSDDTPSTLDNKINFVDDSTTSLSFNAAYNGSTKKLDVTPTIDFVALLTEGLAAIQGNPSLKAAWDSYICSIDCDSTTTTTTTTLVTVSGEISNTGSDILGITLEFGQNNPSVTWFDAGLSPIPAASTISTGSYTVTSSDSPLTGFVVFTNTTVTETNYIISVEDGDGNTVPSSTSASGSLAGGATYSNVSFAYGISPTGQYLLKIEIEASA